MTKLPIETIMRFGDDVSPGFDLVITGVDGGKGTTLFEQVRPLIQSVHFEDDEEMSSMFKLVIVNQPNAELGKPVDWRAVIDSKAFQEGNYIDLYLGYGNKREFIDRVEILKWLPSFPADGPATFQIKGYDGRHKMQRSNFIKTKGVPSDPPSTGGRKSSTIGQKKGSKRIKTSYAGLPDHLIVKKVAEKYGFLVETDPVLVKKKEVFTISKGKDSKLNPNDRIKTVRHTFPSRVQPKTMNDWKFLQHLADINRFDLWIDFSKQKNNWVVHFKRRQDTGSPLFKFTYNGEDGSLIHAEPDFSIKEQPTGVQVLYFDRKKQNVELVQIEDTNKAEDVRLQSGVRKGPGFLRAKKTLGVGARVRFVSFGQTIDAFADKPFASKVDAEKFVEHWLKEKEKELLILKGEVVGLPSLRSRQIHEISGLSTRIDGLYRFTNVVHKIETGSIYKCEFTAHKILSDAITRKPKSTIKNVGETVTKENRKTKYGAKR